MYPGPYSDTGMFPSDGGGINALGGAKGKAEGDCDVYITQKKGDIFTLANVATDVKPGESADDLFKYYKKRYPDHRSQRLTLGSAKGFTTYDQAVLVFDCRTPKKSSSKKETLAVKVQVLLPDYRGAYSVGQAKLAKGAAKLAADTARYVDSEVLKCSSPRLPDNALVLKAPSPTTS